MFNRWGSYLNLPQSDLVFWLAYDSYTTLHQQPYSFVSTLINKLLDGGSIINTASLHSWEYAVVGVGLVLSFYNILLWIGLKTIDRGVSR